jgi:Domain of unknown function (DUF4157)
MADQVMRMADPQRTGALDLAGAAPHGVQRLCPECEDEVRRQPADEEEEHLQMKRASGATAEIEPGLQAQIGGLRGGGRSLPPALRAFFEPRFGHDFGRVRIHTDAQAARARHARAFTVGRDVVFGAGQYTPQTASGRHLLAHELTHVVQQGQQKDLNALSFGPIHLSPSAQGKSSSMTVQRAPEEPAAEPVLADDQANQLDPLLDEEAMEAVAREGARQLDACLTNSYLAGCRITEHAITLSEALSSGKMPEFSEEYEGTIATIRTQALAALDQAKGFLEGLDPKSMAAWGGAALEGVNVAIAAISDGNDIVFIVDSRTAAGQAALAGIEHFNEQMAIRKRGFRDASDEPARVSAGLSRHEGQTDLGRPEVTPKVEHRSVSILDIGALYDNRALANFVGPIQDPPGTLHIETAAAVDLRALFIHEVGGHALDIESPAEKEARAHGGRLDDAMEKAHEVRMESLVDNMVDKVAFLSFIRDDLPRDLIRRLGE